MYRFISTVLIFSCCFITTLSFCLPCDSIETKTIDGKSTIFHQVDKGETYYSISKRYHLTVEQVKTANGKSETLSIGTILRLPNIHFVPSQANGKTHVVQPKETLFAIARKHQVSVKQLQEWNHLQSYAIHIGQTLIVNHSPAEEIKSIKSIHPQGVYHTIQKGQTLYSISKKYKVSVSDLKKWNKIESSDGISIGTKLIVNHGHKLEKHKSITTSKLKSTKTLLKVQDNESMNKEFSECLYDGAAEGDILKITHTSSKKTIFVKVAGHITTNTKAKIIINSKAAEKLGTSDTVFHVQVTEVH